MNKVLIFGHRKPDTDSVCGAISLSYLKNKLGVNAEPRILSEINHETAYALKNLIFLFLNI
jgi:manganese-dependent inorganic pyrophosphatase